MQWQRKTGTYPMAFGAEDYSDGMAPNFVASLKTYDEQIDDQAVLETIRSELDKAERVVFLGFHFHDQNMELLTIPTPKVRKQIYATSVERSDTDLTVIQGQIHTALKHLAPDWTSSILKRQDCRGLFKEYRTLFAA